MVNGTSQAVAVMQIILSFLRKLDFTKSAMWMFVCVVVLLYKFDLFVELLWVVLRSLKIVDRSVVDGRELPADSLNSGCVRFVLLLVIMIRLVFLLKKSSSFDC